MKGIRLSGAELTPAAPHACFMGYEAMLRSGRWDVGGGMWDVGGEGH